MGVYMSFDFSDQIFLNIDTHESGHDVWKEIASIHQYLCCPLPGTPHRHLLVPEHPGGAV